MLRGRGFCYPASPLSLEKPLTLRARQAHSRRVPQLSRFRVHSERRGRVLLCRDAFAYCLARTAYCGTDLVSRADRSRARVPVCWSRVHPKASVVSADDKIFENGVVAGRVSRLGSNHCLSLTRPLLRIGDPSPYAPSPPLPKPCTKLELPWASRPEDSWPGGPDSFVVLSVFPRRARPTVEYNRLVVIHARLRDLFSRVVDNLPPALSGRLRLARSLRN